MKNDTRGSRPLVYVCYPFAGDFEHNVQKARAYSRFAVEEGVVPIAPHLLFPQFMDDENAESRAIALDMGLRILMACTELWYFGNSISPGMALEIERAVKGGMRIRHFTDDCKEVTL